jgi:hypothetical protein
VIRIAARSLVYAELRARLIEQASSSAETPADPEKEE